MGRARGKLTPGRGLRPFYSGHELLLVAIRLLFGSIWCLIKTCLISLSWCVVVSLSECLDTFFPGGFPDSCSLFCLGPPLVIDHTWICIVAASSFMGFKNTKRGPSGPRPVKVLILPWLPLLSGHFVSKMETKLPFSLMEQNDMWRVVQPKDCVK